MRHRRTGFSLIELLIVVGMLAILAALLFPVLRQAQRSASEAVCMMNFRQAGMAMSLYSSDNTDLAVVAAYDLEETRDSTNDRKWPQLVRPYFDEPRILRCPRDPFPGVLPGATFDPDLVHLKPSDYDYALAQRSNIGYNYLMLSPAGTSNNGEDGSFPATLSALPNPARTLLAVDSAWDIDERGRPVGGGHYLVVPPCRYAQKNNQLLDLVRLPSGFLPFFAHDRWLRNQEQVNQYGGAYPWHDGKMTVVYLDGHVKMHTPEMLTAGCNVESGEGGVVNNSDSYLWGIP